MPVVDSYEAESLKFSSSVKMVDYRTNPYQVWMVSMLESGS